MPTVAILAQALLFAVPDSPAPARQARSRMAMRSGAAEASDARPALEQHSSFSGSELQWTVRNTFVDLDTDDSPSAVMARPARCCKTLPADALQLCGCEAAAQEAGCTTGCVGDLHCCTPTPWPEAEDPSQLRFWTPPPAIASAALPQQAAWVNEVRSSACAAAPPAPAVVIFQDRHLCIRQTATSCRAEWTVDAKKLRGSDKQVVSPPFDVALLPGQPPCTFKLMLYPKATLGIGGGTSFRKAAGVGHIQLKCCSELPEDHPATCVRVGVGANNKTQWPRGPFKHGFGSSSVFNLPKEQADWSFTESVELQGQTLMIDVELAPAK